MKKIYGWVSGVLITLFLVVGVAQAEVLIFSRTSNGNWDNVANYTPSRLPVVGDTVICEVEMETTSTIFEAEIIIRGAGSLRLRGNHKSTGTIYLEEGTFMRYNTGGTGMALDAPISADGNILLLMESDNAGGSILTLSGPVSGNDTIMVINNGKGVPNTGKLLLTGDNTGFSGVWNLAALSIKYPDEPGYISLAEGNSKNAFGHGKITVAHNNKVIFNHQAAVSETLTLDISGDAKAVLQTNLIVKEFILNGTPVPDGQYSVSTDVAIFEGAGVLIVGEDTPEPEQLPAFPGAEGHGKYVTGGRGGRVIYVTNLNDDNNEGSLRYAINQAGPRIILFKVSGNIQLKSNLNINQGDVTIAGQTAPGDGITLRDYTVYVNSDNVILRYLRFRMGDETNQINDAIWGRNQKDIIIDHCSMSWATDEVASFYDNENFTLQWCILSESLRNSIHEKGRHGYAGIWGGRKASFHHNLLAHHDSRNPRFNGSRYSNQADNELVDFRNNTIYNWGSNSAYAAEGGRYNIVNNYYKAGPATSSNRSRILQPYADDGSNNQPAGTYGTFYITGNYVTASAANTNNNWLGVNMHSSFPNGITLNDIRSDSEFDKGDVTTHSAEFGYEKVLELAGASLFRDEVDFRIIKDVSTGTATFTDGGNGSTNGLIDTQAAVDGWPELYSSEAPLDSDNDGMPDFWEDANGLNKYNPDDAQLTTVDGKYPNIEVYINSLVAEITASQQEEGPVSNTLRLFASEPEPEILFNSFTGKLEIKHQSRIHLVQAFTVTGSLILSEPVREHQAELYIKEKGIILIRIIDENQHGFSKKIAIH
ncbi:MAG: hypothetical protein K0B11_03405 [Mariniphaga sp.]|nr:hypothetical protein [Mariniphaga sp.]